MKSIRMKDKKRIPNLMRNPLYFVICSNPRCGGQYLCSLMASNSIMKPLQKLYRRGAELLNYDSHVFEIIKVNSKEDLQGLFSYVYKDLALIKRYSGFRVHAKHILDLEKRIGSNIDKRELFAFFPKNTRFIWLVRKDKIKQAVSYLIASKTKQWFIGNPKQKTDITSLKFGIEEIRKTVYELMSYDDYWKEFFKENKIRPHLVYYEVLDSNPRATIKKIFRYLNIKKRKITVKTFLIKQSDEYKDEIIKNAKKYFRSQDRKFSIIKKHKFKKIKK